MRACHPTPAEVADALNVHSMGGDLRKLAEVCEDQANRHPPTGAVRLRRAAEVERFVADGGQDTKVR